MQENVSGLIQEVERHTHVWLSSIDIALLLKAGMPMTGSSMLLRSGVFAMWKTTRVYVDRNLKPGELRLLGGEVVKVPLPVVN